MDAAKILVWLKNSFSFLQDRQDKVLPAKKLLIFLFSFPLIVFWKVFRLLRRRNPKPLELISDPHFGFRMKFHLLEFIESYFYLFGIWEPDITAFVRRRLKPGDVFLDVGAHVGYYTLLASNLVGDRGRVIAIEASPKNFSLLQSNLELNNGRLNVKPMNIAATDSAGKVKIYSAPDYNLGWTTGLRSRGFPMEAEVEGQPITHLIKEADLQKVRLVKIDVEGMEEKVISGLKRVLEEFPKDVEFIIELSPLWWPSPKHSLEEMIQPFITLGFFPYRVFNDYSSWRYLWPNTFQRPQRIRGKIPELSGQIDLVLSRRDAEEL